MKSDVKICSACGSQRDLELTYPEAFDRQLCTCGYEDENGLWPELESFDDCYSDDGYETDASSDYPCHD